MTEFLEFLEKWGPVLFFVTLIALGMLVILTVCFACLCAEYRNMVKHLDDRYKLLRDEFSDVYQNGVSTRVLIDNQLKNLREELIETTKLTYYYKGRLGESFDD